jgi:hypothetical protein
MGAFEAFAMLLVSLHQGVLLLLIGETVLVGHSHRPDEALDLLLGISA